ncbi:hypothetical protein [Cumulibacter manganitolerans]|uniref:hypothetical protein n=1 Tax=Cumulibacter manganitolerans TaxID=1884992 RepID=UPI0012963831|nr:hypothetical protein [Cumulibacter manganitolerans]
MPTPPRKTFTPAIIAALVGLVALAVVTVIVVVRSGNDPAGSGTGTVASGADAGKKASSGGSGDSSSDGSGSAGGSSGADGGAPVTSSDGAFTFSLPSGYQDAIDLVDVPSAVAAAYDPASDSSFQTTIVVTTEPAKGTPIDQIVTNGRDSVESSLQTTTEDLTPSMSSIDGEKVAGYSTGEYDKGGVTLRSAVIVTVHDDTAYAFIVNVQSDKTSEGGNALSDLIGSVSWI